MFASPTRERLSALRAQIPTLGVDALLVRSADAFLNEYVPPEDSTRVFLTGFTGSMGEALVLEDQAYVAADGRYWLQAEEQLADSGFELLRVPLSSTIDATLMEQLKKVAAARTKPLRLGFEVARMTVAELDTWRKTLGDAVSWTPLHPSPVEILRGPLAAPEHPVHIRALDEQRLGSTVEDKLGVVAEDLARLGVDALLVQRLDDIAYLTNLRGDELPYQATFRALALVTPRTIWLGVPLDHVSPRLERTRPSVRFVSPQALWGVVAELGSEARVGFDPQHNTELARLELEQSGVRPVSVTSPVGAHKARKSPQELVVMKEAFARADRVIDQAQRWLCERVLGGAQVSEKGFAACVERLFFESGATGLSFRVISAAGANGAVIHYSDPSPDVYIQRGDIVLLDTGAYYEEGFATDLTRTFLVGAPEDRGTDVWRARYTRVLKAAIAGMSAVIPETARGVQLDAIVRAPLWAAGLDYNHGTGHGVGINVHEFPPRIGPLSQLRLEEGHVFSIEPGVYLPGEGGVRIENLCTVERVPEAPTFLRVVPLTFSPLDARLIEPALLSPDERAFLARYFPTAV